MLPGQNGRRQSVCGSPPGPGGDIVGYTAISADIQVATAPPPLIYQVHIADLRSYTTRAPLSPALATVPCKATITAVFTPVKGGPSASRSQVALTITDATSGPTLLLLLT